MAQKFINNWSTTLSRSLAPSETVLQVPLEIANRLASIMMQGDYCLLTLDDNGQIEIVKTVAIINDEILVERAQEGTVANSWLIGTKIEARITADTLERLQSNSTETILNTEFFEGPGELNINVGVYRLYFGGPGLKHVHLPNNLTSNQRHDIVIYGVNTNGALVSVQIGDNNVTWHSSLVPDFPASGNLVETILFTLDGGNQWYGKVLGTY